MRDDATSDACQYNAAMIITGAWLLLYVLAIAGPELTATTAVLAFLN